MIILSGVRATRARLAEADFNPGISLATANRRPGRVASAIPAIAATMARISSSLLLEGRWNALPSPLPAQVKNTTIKIKWITAPARLLTPTAATPALGSTPDFCKNLTFSAIPPTLDGETRLTNEDAPW